MRPIKKDAGQYEHFDVLVIGSGMSGLLSALILAEQGASVMLVSKHKLGESNSLYAQGGISISLPAGNNLAAQAHFEDTIKSGAGLCNQAAVQAIITHSHKLVTTLENFGIRFDKKSDNSFHLAKEGGHSQNRILHCQDLTGKSVVETLRRQCRKQTKLVIVENCHLMDLIVKDNTCYGAVFLNPSRGRHLVFARRTILASGGYGQLYARTTNPAGATGDGIASAFRAGALLADMEFVQFHPTAAFLPGHPPFLITEATRGAGAVLLDNKHQPFMSRFSKDGDLSTRDLVSTAMHTVMQEQSTGNLWLDLRPIGKKRLQEDFPGILQALFAAGLDPFRNTIPVAPAAHYCMGGIRATVSGATSVAALYALGEAATTGLHGANRLASNSLLECGVMSILCAENLASNKVSAPDFSAVTKAGKTIAGQAGYKVWSSNLIKATAMTAATIRQHMYQSCGLLKEGPAIEKLLQNLNQTEESAGDILSAYQIETANLHTLAIITTRAALERRESRGCHQRKDYPHTDDSSYACHLNIKKNELYWSRGKIANQRKIAV